MLYLFLVSLFWAFSFGLVKTNLATIHPVLISMIRLGVALLVFLPFLRIRGLQKSLLLKFLLIGAIQFGLMYIFYNTAFQYLKAYEVALFTIFTPIFVTLIYDFLHKKPNWIHLSTSLLAIIGTGIIVQTGFNRPGMLIGFLVVQLSNISFAVGQVFYKEIMSKVPLMKDQNVFGVLYLGGAGITALLSIFVVPWSQVTISSTQAWTLLYLGAVASGLGFFLWNFGARRTNIGALAIFNDLKIPLSITVSLLFFGEKASIPHLLLGGVIIAIALVINEVFEYRSRKKQQILSTESVRSVSV